MLECDARRLVDGGELGEIARVRFGCVEDKPQFFADAVEGGFV